MSTPDALGKAHLRIVRPTDDVAANVRFYRDGLGFEVLPYWDRKGKTFEDPDGYRVVLQQSSWPD